MTDTTWRAGGGRGASNPVAAMAIGSTQTLPRPRLRASRVERAGFPPLFTVEVNYRFPRESRGGWRRCITLPALSRSIPLAPPMHHFCPRNPSRFRFRPPILPPCRLVFPTAGGD